MKRYPQGWTSIEEALMRKRCFGRMIMFTTCVLAASSAQAPAQMRAYDFYSKFGVNGNLDSGGWIAAELADMNYIGIKNIRSFAYNANPADADAWFGWIASLSAQGVRQHIDMGATGNMPLNNVADWVAALKKYIVIPYGAQMVAGVSGPNEVDLGQYFGYKGKTGVPAANAAQADLYAAMKADPALSNIPVDMWPVSYRVLVTGDMTAQVGNQTASCDRRNLHDYYATDMSNGGITAGLPRQLANAAKVCNRLAFITTETGWYTPIQAGWQGSGANEYVQARLLLNDLFDHAMLPENQGVYIFTLRWGTVDFSDPGWGVMHDDGTPKISGTALHNLMPILNDPGVTAACFVPTPLQFSLSGMPLAGKSFYLAKSDGSYLLLLWNETRIWDQAKAVQVAIPTSSVTVTLPAGSSGAVYDPVNAAPPKSTFLNVNRVTVALNDAPIVIAVNKPQAPAASLNRSKARSASALGWAGPDDDGGVAQ